METQPANDKNLTLLSASQRIDGILDRIRHTGLDRPTVASDGLRKELWHAHQNLKDVLQRDWGLLNDRNNTNSNGRPRAGYVYSTKRKVTASAA